MNSTLDINNEGDIFDIDSYMHDQLVHASMLQSPSPSSQHDASTSEEEEQRELELADQLSLFTSFPSGNEGKGTTKPLSILTSPIVNDVFEISPPSSQGIQSHFSISSSPLTSSYQCNPISVDGRPHIDLEYESSTCQSSPVAGPSSFVDASITSSSRKGKVKALPPTLPPLEFSSANLDLPHTGWLNSPSPPPVSPSLYELSFPSPESAASLPSTSSPRPITPLAVPTLSSPSPAAIAPPLLTRVPSRRHSLSSLPLRTTHSPALRSMSRMKLNMPPSRTSRIPSGLARALMFRRRTDFSGLPPPNGHNSLSTTTTIPRASTPHEQIPAELNHDTFSSFPWFLETDCSSIATDNSHKGKGKAAYSPLTFSALDIIPVTPPTLVFQPIPTIVKNYFDEYLPKELRLRVLLALLDVFQVDYDKVIQTNYWSMARASSSKWRYVGRNRGLRELVKFSRVSRQWQHLMFDGQIWADVDLRVFPASVAHVILRIASTGGPFLKCLHINGHDALSPESLLKIADDLCLASSTHAYTQLTSINLQGCTRVSTRALHHLLVRSRSLMNLQLKGLDAVTNITCSIIASYCPQLTHLNLSRCPNLDATGIRRLTDAAIVRGETLVLKELRVSGLKYVNDGVMTSLGRACPHLEVLDLSYSRHLHNSALNAFVACQHDDLDDEDYGVRTILLSGRDIGYGDQDLNKYRRRVTYLRHLNISHCLLLTDIACSNLAHSVPKLEFLEMAGIGGDVKDEGLVRMLGTTPNIRRLDLEDAVEITDAVIKAITPFLVTEEDEVEVELNVGEFEDEPDIDGDIAMSANQPILPETKRGAEESPQPGHCLEHLIISYATRVTEIAVLNLIRNCPRLINLEVDNTRISSNVIREFVHLSRERKLSGARLVAVDCRHINELVVKELSPYIRPRSGWRTFEARGLRFLDERGGHADDLKAGLGQNECDNERVALKNFYSWQIVDAVKAARDKRRKSALGRERRELNDSFATYDELDEAERGAASDSGGNVRGNGRRLRWWTPGNARRARESVIVGGASTPTGFPGNVTGRGGLAPGRTSPLLISDTINGDSCIIM